MEGDLMGTKVDSVVVGVETIVVGEEVVVAEVTSEVEEERGVALERVSIVPTREVRLVSFHLTEIKVLSESRGAVDIGVVEEQVVVPVVKGMKNKKCFCSRFRVFSFIDS